MKEKAFTFSRGVTLKNRLMMAPMTTNMSFYDGVVTSDEVAYYGLHAGDLGAIITGVAYVQDDGKGWLGELSVSDDKYIPGLSKIAGAIKQNGTKAILQIFHAGRMTKAATIGGKQIVSAGNIPSSFRGMETPREMTGDEVENLIANFKAATIRAIKAGFDGVELHGANNYLIQQFYSPHSNRRTDRWGGSRENRFHFIDKLTDAVIEAVEENKPEGFIIGYRFSPEEHEDPGIRMEDTLYLVDQLANKRLDYLHLSLVDYDKMSREEAFQEKTILEYVHEKIAGRIPLVGIGNIRTGQDAENVLKISELAAVGRSLLVDPKWASKVLDGREDEIHTTLSEYDKDERMISNGTWKFLTGMMPDRLIYKDKK